MACLAVSAPGRESFGVFAGNISTVACLPFSLSVAKSRLKTGTVAALSSKNGESMVPVDENRDRRPMRRRWRDDSAFGLLEAWDPFAAGSLKQMMDTVDRLFDTSFNAATPGTMRSGIRTPWDVIEDEQGFHLRVDLPGFGKEDIKVSVQDQVLIIKAERKAEVGEGDKWASRSVGQFNTQVALPDNVVLQEIKAEMKNGVLTVTVPKVKPEEKKVVMDVEIS